MDISLEAEGPGSSLATTTIPDMMDLVSVGSSFNRTGSDILLPPLLPESRSLVHMRKLKSLDKVTAKLCVYSLVRTSDNIKIANDLKGLSHEMDLAFEDIRAWLVLSQNRGRGQFLNFYVLQ